MNHAVPRDPALPQLATALNGQAMAEVFASQLHSHGQLKVQGCTVNRVKYRPRRNCSVSYTLALRDQTSGRAFEQRVAARFCVDGDSARRHAKLSGRASHPSAAGPTLTHLASLDVVLQWAPNDPRLDAVAELHDDARLGGRWLPELVAAMTCGQGRLLDHRTNLVQYVPEHRVCARIDMQLQELPGASIVTRTVYAKADAEQRGPVTHKVMQVLSGSAAQLTGKLRTPRSILWQAESGLHWQEGVAGRAVLELSPHLDPALAARIGALLAALHSTPVSTPRVDTVAEIEQRPRQVADILGLVDAGWQLLLTRLVSTLEAGARKLASLPVVTLHGDLHPHNILLDGRNLTLIDLDSVRLGSAMSELGAWVADALYRAALDDLDPDAVRRGWRAFLGGYADAAGPGIVAQPLLAWSTAYHLLCKRAYRCVANLQPGRFEVVPKLLALADSIASAGTVCVDTTRELESA